MIPFTAKPGEVISGLGFDFVKRLAQGETISGVAVSADAPLSTSGAAATGTEATVSVAVASDAADGSYPVVFAVTGSLGSVRKAARTILVRAASD